MNNSSNNTPWFIFACCALAGILAVCAVCVAAFGAYFWLQPSSQIELQSTVEVGVEDPAPRPTRQASPTEPFASPQDPPGIPVQTPAASSALLTAAEETLRTFNQEIVPVNDPIELAMRLEGRTGLARALEFPVDTFAVGDRQSFWITNGDSNSTNQIPATLRYITDHVYFWIEDGVEYDNGDLRNLVETFEAKIYPRNREFFGSEWTPGVDADPHLYILFARGLGNSIAGYYSSGDQYLPVVREKTNGHEMFLISAEHVYLGEEYAYGVLAHEFQHMIHWYRDRNEETWINEGFADLAMFLNGYSVGGADQTYASMPEIQLNDWPTAPEERSAHYGGAFLFLTYFLDRFGEEATKLLVSDEANGMTGIDDVLTQLGAVDGETGQPIGADEVFADWVVASFLNDGNIEDGRYAYHNYPQAPSPSTDQTISDCSRTPFNGEVRQYGVTYLRLRCGGGLGFLGNDYTLRFSGAQSVGALPVGAFSGDYVFYSNRGDESDMTLTHSFDFSGVDGPLTLTYHTWYDLEEDYDYLYLLASEDGQTWDILTTPDGTAEDPVGNSYGWGYNGASGNGPEWIEQEVDLSQYAGKKVQLRFEYITDAAVNGEGLLLDDVSIPEIGYATDFESDEGGWAGEGFVRIQNVLPQTFRLAVIQFGDQTSVDKFVVPAGGMAEIPLTFDRSTSEVVLVVSGTTRFTRQPASYRIEFSRR